MSSKGRRGSKRRVGRDLAARLLSTLSQDKAFHFYLDVDKPTGIYANSLQEFSQRLLEVDPKSVSFHLKRGDFGNWLSEAVGDKELASKIEGFKDLPLPIEELRSKVHNEVRARFDELSTALTV
ncbi:MAG: DUF5752 family protein [Candidatus Bathyarchaeia archaeon]